MHSARAERPLPALWTQRHKHADPRAATGAKCCVPGLWQVLAQAQVHACPHAHQMAELSHDWHGYGMPSSDLHTPARLHARRPSTCLAPTDNALQAWSALSGVLCVSQFIRDYLRSHWSVPPPSSPPPAPSQDSQPSSASHGPLPAHPGGPLPQPPMRVVPLSAWGCFGHGPFNCYAAQALAQLAEAPWEAPTAQASDYSSSIPAQTEAHEGQPGTQGPEGAGSRQPPPRGPILGVLKLTPEKGASIVLELARRTRGRCRCAVLLCQDWAMTVMLNMQIHVQMQQPRTATTLLMPTCVLLMLFHMCSDFTRWLIVAGDPRVSELFAGERHVKVGLSGCKPGLGHAWHWLPEAPHAHMHWHAARPTSILPYPHNLLSHQHHQLSHRHRRGSRSYRWPTPPFPPLPPYPHFPHTPHMMIMLWQ